MVKDEAKISKNLRMEEDKFFYQDDTSEIPPADVFAYNELRSCADLVRLFKSKTLNIQPEFQREFVWRKPEQTRFIDSLAKALPIPSMCFAVDVKTQKWIVIDGLQRMSTIIKFLDDDKWTLSSLREIDSRISGKEVYEIKNKHPDLYRSVENLALPITILRCDLSKKSHTNYIFTIFSRLNTGGMKLNNQELRNAIYQGELNDLLKTSNNFDKWNSLLGVQSELRATGDRFKRIELILRFYAFFDNYKNYNGRLAKFLNDYMESKQKIAKNEINQKKVLFENTVAFVYEKIAKKTTFNRVSNAFLEALLFGVAKNIKSLELNETTLIEYRYQQFSENKIFSPENIREGILKREKVFKRLETAEKIFRG